MRPPLARGEKERREEKQYSGGDMRRSEGKSARRREVRSRFARLSNLRVALLVVAIIHLIVKPLDAQQITVVSYNVENLFSPGSEPANPDTAFTPAGKMHWTTARLDSKLHSVARAIIAAGEWEMPDIVGLCEVETHSVLSRLTEGTPLRAGDYGIIHRDSPDRRGVDVALLYRRERLRALCSAWVAVMVDSTARAYSRDVLYTAFEVPTGDTLHVVLCHWPSRYGGGVEKESARKRAARRTRRLTDSIQEVSPAARIVVMGDFNATPEEDVFAILTAPRRGLGRLHIHPPVPEGAAGLASYKYRGVAQSIDLFLLSSSLLRGPGIQAQLPPRVCTAPFLLEADNRYGGKRPRRTYLGPRYHGGVSDHLPIVLRLEQK